MYVDDSQASDASMILVMGLTGSGKSHFINKVVGRDVATESESLHSCTSVCTGFPVEIGRSKVILIDTPGFDDSARTDTDILTEIARMLAAQYRLKVNLKGVIYLHRISDDRFGGASGKTLRVFKKLCGEASLPNVILATTRWDSVTETLGAKREQELRRDFWQDMIAKGSYMTRFGGDRDSAIALISQLLGSNNIVFDIQRQLVDEGKTLDQTGAGAVINGELGDQIARTRRELQESMNEVENLRQTMSRNDKLQQEREEETRQRYEMKLRQMEKERVRLQSDVATEVRQEMELEQAKVKKRGKKLGIVAPILPTALMILGAFIGVPSSMTDLFSSWILGDESGGGGMFDTLSELFNF